MGVPLMVGIILPDELFLIVLSRKFKRIPLNIVRLHDCNIRNPQAVIRTISEQV